MSMEKNAIPVRVLREAAALQLPGARRRGFRITWYAGPSAVDTPIVTHTPRP